MVSLNTTPQVGACGSNMSNLVFIRENCSLPRALVNGSVHCEVVGMNWVWNMPLWTFFDKVTINLNIFCALMVDYISSNVGSCLIVT
jgi:hypothetical protein